MDAGGRPMRVDLFGRGLKPASEPHLRFGKNLYRDGREMIINLLG